MILKNNWAIGVLALGTLASACRSTAVTDSPQPTATVGSDLVGGTPSNPSNSSAVFIYAANGSDPSEWFDCGGVMIGPNVLLTAGHCVATTEWYLNQQDGLVGTVDNLLLDGAKLRVGNGSTVPDKSTLPSMTVQHAALHPDLVASCAVRCDTTGPLSTLQGSPTDLGLVALTTPFPTCFGPPADLSVVVDGEDVVQVGWGCQTATAAGTAFLPVFTTAVASVLSSDDPGIASLNLPSLTQKYFLTAAQGNGGPASVCQGDSGGPVFKGDFSNGGHVVGINSSILNLKNTPAAYNSFARVNSATTTKWIASFMAQYAIAAPPAPPRGEPVNEISNLVSIQFPSSTVGLLSSDGYGCTGVVLTSTSILTAAHCHVDRNTTIELYLSDENGGSTPVDSLPGSAIGTSDFPSAIDCNREVTGSFPQDCYSPLGAGSVYADLQVVNLNTSIPDAYSPVVLAPSGSYADRSNDVSWMVATGGGGSMQWAPISNQSSSDTTGLVSGSAPFGSWGDSGGPLFQYATATDATAKQPNVVLIGIASAIGPLQGDCTSSQSHGETFTSVVQPDVYEWLVESEHAQEAPANATFGAAQ